MTLCHPPSPPPPPVAHGDNSRISRRCGQGLGAAPPCLELGIFRGGFGVGSEPTPRPKTGTARGVWGSRDPSVLSPRMSPRMSPGMSPMSPRSGGGWGGMLRSRFFLEIARCGWRMTRGEPRGVPKNVPKVSPQPPHGQSAAIPGFNCCSKCSCSPNRARGRVGHTHIGNLSTPP